MARSDELNKKMKDERKEEILKGSLKLFATNGLSATKISDIAKECKMSQGLIYHYYKNKDQIFIELIDNAFDKLIEACNWLNDQKLNPLDKISLAFDRIMEMIVEDKAFSYNSLLIAQASANLSIPEEAKKIIIEKNEIPYQIIGKIFNSGIKSGDFKDYRAEEMATLFWTSINGLAIYISSHGESSAIPNHSLLISMFKN